MKPAKTNSDNDNGDNGGDGGGGSDNDDDDNPHQWRTQEFCSGGFNKFSSGQRTERMGIWGR